MKEKTFVVLLIIVALAGMFLRVYDLENKPIHHDESILEFYYLKPIANNYALRYLGTEYHGLAPYFFCAPILKILGVSLFSIRLCVGLFGSLTILLFYFLRKRIGRVGSFMGAMIVSFSPTFVYYSRQFTGYPFFLFFLLLQIILFLKLLEGEHKGRWLFWNAFVLAILFNINEAILIQLFFALSFVLVWAIYKKEFRKKALSVVKEIKLWQYLIALGIFIGVFLVIHTHFFFETENLTKLLSVASDFSNKASNTGHNKPFLYYLGIMSSYEIAIVLAAICGILLFKKDAFSIFLMYWGYGSLLLFSIVNYKTNWTMVVFLFPLVLHSANSLDEYAKKGKNGFVLLIIASVLVGLILCVFVNFYWVNNNELNKIGYVETSVEMWTFEDDIREYAQGRELMVLINPKSYWPLPTLLDGHTLFYNNELETLYVKDYPEYDILITSENRLPEEPSGYDIKEYEMRKNYKIKVLYKQKEIQ